MKVGTDYKSLCRIKLSSLEMGRARIRRQLGAFKSRVGRPNPGLLPDDIWMLILEMGDFDILGISNFRLACKYFAALGALERRYHYTLRPMNMRRTVAPWFSADIPDLSDSFLIKSSDVDLAVDPSRIYHCRVMEGYDAEISASGWTTITESQTYIPLTQVLPIIFQLTNLIRLELRRITLGDEVLASLHQFHNLQTLRIENCVCPAQKMPIPRPIRVSNFYFKAPR